MTAPDGLSLSGVSKTFSGRGKVVEALRDFTSVSYTHLRAHET